MSGAAGCGGAEGTHLRCLGRRPELLASLGLEQLDKKCSVALPLLANLGGGWEGSRDSDLTLMQLLSTSSSRLQTAGDGSLPTLQGCHWPYRGFPSASLLAGLSVPPAPLLPVGTHAELT